MKNPDKERYYVGIVGSRNFRNEREIRKLLFYFKEKLGDKAVIVSGGQPRGADGLAKKIALDFDMDYIEFPPRHYSWNQYCVYPPEYYGQPYKVWYFNERNTDIAEYCNAVIGFLEYNYSGSGTMDTLNKARKMKKIVKIFQET